MMLRLPGSTHYPYSRDTKPGVDRSHSCYRKGGPRVRFVWVSCEPLSVLWRSPGRTYIRALHGEIGSRP